MTKFKITSKEKFGDMPKGTTLTVETPLSSCDPDKIKAAIKAAGFNKQAHFCIESIRITIRNCNVAQLGQVVGVGFVISTAIIYLTYYLQVTERILRSIQTDMSM